MRLLAFAIVLAASCARGPHAEVPSAPREANATCASCHAKVADEWRASAHARAFRDPSFQEAYRIEPLPFCAGCHAPLGPSATDQGVSCVSCHPGGKRAIASTCHGCHEFPYPPGVEPGRLLQKTVSEHAASSRARVECTECHAGHRVAASRDPALVRSAARIEARRDGGRLLVTFTRGAVGHAFPTGDLFRRLVVEVESESGVRRVALGRLTKREAEIDTRPFADGRDTFVAEVPGVSGPARWRVVYERVQHPTEEDGLGAVLEGSIEVARGELP